MHGASLRSSFGQIEQTDHSIIPPQLSHWGEELKGKRWIVSLAESSMPDSLGVLPGVAGNEPPLPALCSSLHGTKSSIPALLQRSLGIVKQLTKTLGCQHSQTSTAIQSHCQLLNIRWKVTQVISSSRRQRSVSSHFRLSTLFLCHHQPVIPLFRYLSKNGTHYRGAGHKSMALPFQNP